MDVAAEIGRLETLSPADVRARWSAVTGSVVPKVSPRLLRLALAWELQAKAAGGLSRETTRTLDQLARGLTRTTAVQPDMRRGRVIRWDGREWRSLSEVARAITGTRWSGPAFFGLKKRVAA